MSIISALAGNVLTNPGFESDPVGETTSLLGWNAYGGNAYSETGPTTAHSGTNCFKVYQAFNGQVNYTGIYQDYISGPGATYSADGWACISSGDVLIGQNVAWIEVTFRDASANVLALYRSSFVKTNVIITGAFPKNLWIDLPVTNQYNLNTYAITNRTAVLTAPAGTYFVRYQIVLQGDSNPTANGSVYFDDLTLNLTSASAYGNWNIVWDDAFNGTNINTNIWTYDIGTGCPGNCGWGNNELEYYTSRTNNAYVAGGFLHIVAQQESYGGQSYTSARMKSQGLFSCKYGRLEWRAQLPGGAGFWPALWLLGTNITSIGWPSCGEIDVMENNGAVLNNVQGSLHSGTDETASYTLPNGGSVTNFHTYTLDWSTNAILYYVDGHLYQTQIGWGTSVVGQSFPFPFNQPFFILMNLAIGGNYVGSPNGTSVFPAQMQVDYVRIYAQTSPLQIALTRTNNRLSVSWPSNVVAHVQEQINPANMGLGTNWSNLSLTSNPTQFYPTNGSTFFRLQSP